MDEHRLRCATHTKDDRSVYNQSSPMSIDLKEEIVVESVLLNQQGKRTVLSFSKYANPCFVRKKLHGTLVLLVNLRKFDVLIADDNINRNHSVSVLSEAAKNLAGKSLYCELDCFRAYHCLHMADHRSVEMFAFILASEKFALKKLAQGTSRSVPAFSKIVHE